MLLLCKISHLWGPTLHKNLWNIKVWKIFRNFDGCTFTTISPEREKLKIISQIFFELEIIFYIQTSFWWISLDWGQWFESTFLMSKNSFKKSKKISKTEIWKIFWSFSFHNRLEFIIYSEQNWSWRLKSHSIFYFIFEAAFQTIIY